jgi:hypothetical protein
MALTPLHEDGPMFRATPFVMAAALAITFAPAGRDDPGDPKAWYPVRIPGAQKAPEFEGVTEWVNSDPLTMKGLKGKVVVVHFMAFG